MDERPLYEIRVADRGDRVNWALIEGDQQMARGTVLLLDLTLDAAFAAALENANTTRLGRQLNV